MTENTGPAAGGGWWVQSQSDPTGSDPYSIYAGRTDGTGKTIKLSDPRPDQSNNPRPRFNVLPATDGKNAVWWAWGAEDARLMIEPLDGSAPAKEIGSAQAPSFLSVDGDWVSWTSPVYGSPKQYYVNVNKPFDTVAVDQTYYKISGYGSVKNGKLVYLLNWPDSKGYHVNVVVRDLSTGNETMLPEMPPKETDPNAGLSAPKPLDDRIVLGIDQYNGPTSGIMSMKYDGSDPKTIIDETSADAPVLGGYDATDQAVTFENWPGSTVPHIFQIGIDGGAVHPMTCASGMQFRVNADEGTRAVWLDGSYGDTSLVVRDAPRQHC
jgi:bacillolysin